MGPGGEQVTVEHAPGEQRYELRVGGELAGVSEYRGGGPVRAFTHTEVEERFEGRGLAGELVRRALDDVRAQGLHVLPLCPYVKAFLAEHPEYLDLVQPQHRRAFDLPDPAESP